MKAKDIMETSVVTVDTDTKVEDLAKILMENKITGIPVVDGKERVVGIVTESDFLRREVGPTIPDVNSALGGFTYLSASKKYEEDLKKVDALIASEIMTKDLIVLTEDIDVKKIASIMVDKNINRIPIVKDEKLVGIVSRSDIIKTLAQ